MGHLKAEIPMKQVNYYPVGLMRVFLLIKINSLAKPEANVPTKFLEQLIAIFNECPLADIFISLDEQELFSQMLMKIEGENVSEFKHLGKKQDSG